MRSKVSRLVLVLLGIVVAYHWIGIASLVIGLLAFMLYEMLAPPPRYRRMGLGQMQEAVDNKLGHFGRSYPEDEPELELHRRVGRNDPCPCGSGLKFKRCCERVQE
jgi:uncharacterized protein YecA (UPF0149 family)